MKLTYRKSWAENLLMLLALTLGSPSRSNNGSLALVSCLSGRDGSVGLVFRYREHFSEIP